MLNFIVTISIFIFSGFVVLPFKYLKKHRARVLGSVLIVSSLMMIASITFTDYYPVFNLNRVPPENGEIVMFFSRRGIELPFSK